MSRTNSRVPFALANRCLREVAAKLGVSKEQAAAEAVVAYWEAIVGGDRRAIAI